MVQLRKNCRQQRKKKEEFPEKFGSEIVREGVTSVAEMVKVTYSAEDSVE